MAPTGAANIPRPRRFGQRRKPALPIARSDPNIRVEPNEHTTLAGKSVLVVGAGGFIGANLVREIIRRGGSAQAAVRPGGDLTRLTEIAAEVVIKQLDVRDKTETLRVLQSTRPDYVVNLVRRRAEDTPEDRHRMVETHVLGTAALIEGAAAVGCRRLVQLGSSMEYAASGRPLAEDSSTCPGTIFGASKCASTLLCIAAARSGIQAATVLRPFMVYGPWDQSPRLVPTAIRAALEDTPLPLTAPGFRRDWVFVDDVVEAALLGLEGDANGEVVNIGTGVQSANEDVVRLVEEATGRPIEILAGQLEQRPWDAHSWVASTEKARRLLGFRARTSLEEGIRRTIAWTLRRGGHQRRLPGRTPGGP